MKVWVRTKSFQRSAKYDVGKSDGRRVGPETIGSRHLAGVWDSIQAQSKREIDGYGQHFYVCLF